MYSYGAGDNIFVISKIRCPIINKPISVTVMIALIAIASGISNATIACVAIRPAFTAPGLPRILGISATPRPLMKIKTLPAKIPGAARGTTTSLKTQ